MNDKWGRNFLGTPPQGRADYAFFQHILASMDEKTGRCAILFPNGVLSRDEEILLREKLIRTDLVECIIGLGRNLFYNSPMEACVVICRTNKPQERKRKIQFINAISKVERKNAQSYLTEDHIKSISEAYHNYSHIDGYCSVVSIDDILNNNSNLNVTMYAREVKSSVSGESLDELNQQWTLHAASVIESVEGLLNLIEAK